MTTPGDDGQPPPPPQPSWESTQQYGQEYGRPAGQPGPPGYGGGSTPAYHYAAPDHPKATTSLVLGILGVVLCQVLGPFAWVIGKRTLGEIDASHGRLGGRGQAQAGYVLGIVGTVLLALSVLAIIAYVAFIAIVLGGSLAYD